MTIFKLNCIEWKFNIKVFLDKCLGVGYNIVTNDRVAEW